MLEDLIGGSRWRPIAAAMAVIGVGLILFFTIAGGGNAARLPTPPHVAAAARSSHANTSQTTQPDTFTQVDSPPLTGCSASVSDPAPQQSATAETVTVTSVAGAQVRVEADYARTHSVHTTTADTTGKASVSLPINHAQPGVTVPVKVTATLARTKVTCGSSFTPVAAPAIGTLDPLTIFPAVTKLLPGAPTLKQLPALPPPTVTPPGSPPPTTLPSQPPPPPPPPPPPTTTTTPPTTTTVPPTTTTTVPPTTTTTVPPTTTTTTPPTTTTTTPPTTTTTTTLILGL